MSTDKKESGRSGVAQQLESGMVEGLIEDSGKQTRAA